MTSDHRPVRTCIGCRQAFPKDEVVRIVASPTGIVIDYREKLPGRAAYVCPRVECISRALGKDMLSRALHTKVAAPTVDDFIERLKTAIVDRIRSLLGMAAKSGSVAAGYSAVRDGLEKGTIKLLLYTGDISDGTRDKIGPLTANIPAMTLFLKAELGALLGRELTGVAGITDSGFARAIEKESARLNGLLNTGL